jgi:YjbE family integral membrane protein
LWRECRGKTAVVVVMASTRPHCVLMSASVLLMNLNQASALVSVVIIDIVLAGDNAIVVGMAAAGLPAKYRRRVIALGIGAATVLRIAFATVTMHLLDVIGLTFAGGVLLLWVSWKMYRELCDARPAVVAAACGADPLPPRRRQKSALQTLGLIVLADMSMSLDNVIAVAGVARTQSEPWILVVGLVLSVALMGIASTYSARLLERLFWISWVGLGIVTFVALRMIWDGSAQILHQSAALGLH